jgi:hypothetical protein
MGNLSEVLYLLQITSGDFAKLVGVRQGCVRKWMFNRNPNGGRGRGWKVLDVVTSRCKKAGISIDALLEEAERINAERDKSKREAL